MRFMCFGAVVYNIETSVADPHHFYAAPSPAPSENFDAALAPHH
jgi:hypothetical protein